MKSDRELHLHGSESFTYFSCLKLVCTLYLHGEKLSAGNNSWWEEQSWCFKRGVFSHSPLQHLYQHHVPMRVLLCWSNWLKRISRCSFLSWDHLQAYLQRDRTLKQTTWKNDPCFMLIIAMAACINILIAFPCPTAVPFYFIHLLSCTLYCSIIDT